MDEVFRLRLQHELAADSGTLRWSWTDPPAIDGARVEIIVANSIDSQATRVSAAITRLLVDERVEPKDISVLIVRDPKQPIYEALKAKPLPRGVDWSVERHRTEREILVDTVSRFKGLEASIVFLCGLESATEELDGELIYVGISRAKSRITLVGSPLTTNQIAGRQRVE